MLGDFQICISVPLMYYITNISIFSHVFLIFNFNIGKNKWGEFVGHSRGNFDDDSGHSCKLHVMRYI